VHLSVHIHVNKLLHRSSSPALPSYDSLSLLSQSFAKFFSDKIHKLHTSLLINRTSTSPHFPPPFTPPNFSSFTYVTTDEVSKLLSQSPEILEWCASRRLQLKDAKTELIWFGSRANLSKLASSDCSLLVGGDIIKPSTTVRDLGVLLDSQLSLKQHVNKVVSSCWYHIRRLRQVSHCIGQDVMKQLASAFILYRLDYCNSILAGLQKSTIATLQRVQNAAARMVLNLRPRDSISDGLRQLH
jgi:hypothetical protein